MSLNAGNTQLNELYWGRYVRFMYLGDQMVFRALRCAEGRVLDHDYNGAGYFLLPNIHPSDPQYGIYPVDCSLFSQIVFTIEIDVDDTCPGSIKADGRIYLDTTSGKGSASTSTKFEIPQFTAAPGEKKRAELVINIPEDFAPDENNILYLRSWSFYCFPIDDYENYGLYTGKFAVNFSVDLLA